MVKVGVTENCAEIVFLIRKARNNRSKVEKWKGSKGLFGLKGACETGP